VFEDQIFHKASEGTEIGRYKFFTSSPLESTYTDEFDYEGEHIVFGAGGNANVHYVDAKFAVSSHCLVSRVVSPDVVPKYLYHFLVGNIGLLESGFRGAGLKNISKGYIEQIAFRYPRDRRIQERVVGLFDAGYRMKSDALQAAGLLDSLKMSLYLSFFSNSSSTYKSWKIETIRDLASNDVKSMRTGPFGSDLRHSEFVDSGIAVLGIDNVIGNRFQWGRRRFITASKYDRLKRYRVFPGDVLVTIMASVGRSCVVPDDIPLAISTKHLAVVTCDTSRCDPLFLSHTLLYNPEVRAQLDRANRGAIMDGLNLKIIGLLQFHVPPLRLQKDYARNIQRIESMTEASARLQDSAEDLLASLYEIHMRGKSNPRL
jgi:type I restriction enzyme S subunit